MKKNLMEKVSLKELYLLVTDYFKHKITCQMINSKELTVEFVLYDSFAFGLSIDERYGIFGAGLIVGGKFAVLKLFGEIIAVNSDRQSILKSFKRMDEYCRLRLPDKYLEKYDETRNR